MGLIGTLDIKKVNNRMTTIEHFLISEPVSYLVRLRNHGFSIILMGHLPSSRSTISDSVLENVRRADKMFPILTKIKIKNFKTFKGKKEVILKPFTTVIGGNGSGKSNLLDAVAFALGAQKETLRCTRQSDLIFGSDLDPHLCTSASVTAYFNLEEDIEIEFTRVVNWNSYDEYLIDAKVTSQTEYLNRLKILGINISSESLYILQGNIDRFALRSPKELMSLLEKISGSVEYKDEYEEYKRQSKEIRNKLDDTIKKKNLHDLLKRKLTIALQVERNINQMKQTLYSKLQEAYLTRILFMKKHFEEQGNINGEIKNIKHEINVCESQIDLHKKQKFNKEKLIEASELDLIEQKIQLKKCHQEITEINVDIEEMTNQIGKYTCCVEKGLIEIQESEHQIAEMEHILLITNEDMDRLKENILPDYPMLDKKQMDEYFKLEEELEIVASDLSKELQILRSKQGDDKNKLKWEDGLVRTLNNEERLMKLNLKELEIQKTDKQKKLIDAEGSKNKVISTLQKSKHEVQIADSSLRKSKCELEEVTIQLENISMDKYSERLKNERIATLEKLKNEFSGVFGRVIDICCPISDRYRTCVTKVFGKHMKSIVVANEIVAIKCIKFLRKNKITKETFLPLDTIKAPSFTHQLRGITNPVKCIPIRDLVKFEDPYEQVISHIADNTLVCETPEGAQKVAYTLGYKAVSLDGCRYWPSGIMSGGQLNLEREGGLWDQNLAKLQEKKIQLNKEIQCLLKRREIEFRVIASFTEKRQALSTKIKLLQESIKITESHMLEATKVLNEHQTQISIVQKKIEKIKDELKKINIQIIEKEEKYKEIKAQIFKDYFSKLGIPEFNFEDIKRNYYLQMEKEAELRNSKYSLESHIKYELERKTRNEEEVKQWEHYKENIKEKLPALQTKKENINKKIMDITASLNDINNLLTKYNKEINDIVSQIECYEAQIKSLTNDKILLEQKNAINQTEREQMLEELRSILLECQTIGIKLPVRYGGSFKQAVNAALAGRNMNVDFDFESLPPEFILLPPEELRKRYREMNDNINLLKKEIEEKDVQQLVSERQFDKTYNDLRNFVNEKKLLVKQAMKADKKFKAVEEKRIICFMSFFNRLSTNLNTIYQDLHSTELKCSNLTLENDIEIFCGGVYFCYYTPGKPFTPIASLSSGECTLAGLALLYACVSCCNYHLLLLDEIDSSLDFVNTEKIRLLLFKQKENVRVLTVSHKDNFGVAADQILLTCVDMKIDYQKATKVISYSFD